MIVTCLEGLENEKPLLSLKENCNTGNVSKVAFEPIKGLLKLDVPSGPTWP